MPIAVLAVVGAFSWFHWLVVIAVIALLFGGRGKISSLMGDVAHGIRNFREGLKEPPQQRVSADTERETAHRPNAEELRS
jgi:sec-independent protein translocase protein TatA